MSAIEHQYLNVLYEIINHGTDKSDRTGTGTKSIFGYQIIHDMKSGFPLLTTKKMAWKSVVTELLWFLRGDTNIKFLHDNNCHIWDGDYEKSGRTDGELGPIYGKQWRRWNGQVDDISGIGCYHDQIANLINDLKTNPDSRRLMVNAWNVGELDQMVLPPCHYGFQVYTRELSMSEKELWYKNNNINPNEPWYPNFPTRAISLMWNQRSVDTGLGLGFNIASYSLLLMMIAKQVNMVTDEVIGNLGDVHLYLNHIEPIKEQLTREPYQLPTVKISDRVVNDISEYTLDDILLENYKSHPTIKLPLSN